MASNNKKPPKKPGKRARGKAAGWLAEDSKKRSRAKELMGDAPAAEEELPYEEQAEELPEEEAYDYEEEPQGRGYSIPWFRWFFNLGIAVGLMAACVGIVILIYYTKDLPSTDKLYAGPSSPPITIIARDGTTLGTLGGFHGKAVGYQDFPKHLVQAVLATEDRRFFSHMGMDVPGLVRAMLINLRAGRVVQGGSTITQQLAKVAFLTPERTVKRKVQEIILAVWLEYTFTKEEILGMYLNRVYMGAGNYGVDAAAQQYFGKSAADLNLYESAMLAGLLKAPSRYSPFNNPKASYERTRQVLLNMVDAGYITQAEADAQPKRLQDNKTALMHDKARFFVDWVGSLIPEYVTVPEEGVKVITTLDPTLQGQAEEALLNNVAKFEGALVSANTKGEILAMVGGKNYRESQFNRAAQAKRQPGSSFKYFVYLAAMEKGYNPMDTIIDEPVAVKDFNGWWSPQNYHNEYLGQITLQDAFAKSINTAAVKLSEDVGRPQVIEMARRLGISSPLLNTPSLPLGTNEVTLLEMVQAYAHMPNDGRMVRLYAVQQILTNDGVEIYRHQDMDMPRVLDHNTVMKMNQLMMAVTRYGTAQTAKFGRPVAGKTGTTQEHRDAWFVGFTPQLVTGVWVGKDDNTSMGKTTGGTIPATIFREYMVKAHEKLPIEQILSEVDPNAIMEHQQQEDNTPGLLRWFGFGSSKNRRAHAPVPEGVRQTPESTWSVPEGEELTPPWKQTPQQQQSAPSAPPEAEYVPPDERPDDGSVPQDMPVDNGPGETPPDTPASMIPPEERRPPAQQQQQKDQNFLDRIVPDMPKKMPSLHLPELF